MQDVSIKHSFASNKNDLQLKKKLQSNTIRLNMDSLKDVSFPLPNPSLYLFRI